MVDVYLLVGVLNILVGGKGFERLDPAVLVSAKLG
jgi:hypothetical protein